MSYKRFWINKGSLYDYEKIIFTEEEEKKFKPALNSDESYYYEVIEVAALEACQKRLDECVDILIRLRMNLYKEQMHYAKEIDTFLSYKDEVE